MPLLWSRPRHTDSGPTLPPPPLPGPSPAARAAALPESLPPPLPGPSPAARAAALLTETRRRAAAQNGTARLDEGVVQTQKAGAGWRSSTAHIEVKGEAVLYRVCVDACTRMLTRTHTRVRMYADVDTHAHACTGLRSWATGTFGRPSRAEFMGSLCAWRIASGS